MSEPIELEGIATYIFTWFSHLDAKACSKCRSLNRRDYRDQNIHQEVLWDPWYGNIWDLDADHSLAHGVKQYNCRCQLTVRVEFDWSKWRALQELRETISRYGKPRAVYRERETGRFISPRGYMMSSIREARDELQGLRTEVKSTARETAAYQRTFYLTTTELERATGTRNFAEGMTIMRRWIVLANQARLALHALQFARMAAGDPTAWLLAGVTVAETALTVYDLTGC